MPWWLSNTCEIRQAASNPGAWLGPYPTRAAAEAAAQSAGCPGTGPGPQPGPGDWYVVDFTGPPGRVGTREVARQFKSRTAIKPPWTYVAGPFPTRAAAEAYISQHTPVQRGINAVTGAFSWLQDIGHWVGIAVAYITDGAMWRSIGWVALGAALLIIGIILWWRSTEAFKNINTEAASAAAVVAK